MTFRMLKIAVLAAAGLVLAPIPQVVRAELFGNTQGSIDFPQGAISFADIVVDYSPVINDGQPSEANRQSAQTLGPPDYAGGGTCEVAAACRFASLGDGGNITVRFVDNRLTGSGSSAADLWVFEVGPDIEDTFVHISKDGTTWHAVGKVFGSTAGVDIDTYGFGPADLFSHVRLTDDGNEGDQFGLSVGADIDALGAITTTAAPPIPEPATHALMLIGLGMVAFSVRRLGRA